MIDPAILRQTLEALRGRVRRMFVAYGSVRLVTSLALALVVVFALDRALVLPPAVRLTFLGAITALLIFLVLRGILYPLRKRILAEDIALKVEERYPELDGRLISTLELDGDALDPAKNVSRELVDELRRETAKRLEGVDFERVFDPRPLRRMGAAAAVLLALVAGYSAWQPRIAGIFVHRLFGGATRWPQETQLAVAFPETASHFSVEYDGDRPVRVKLARGASLPVTVRADGTAPKFVELAVEGGSQGRAVPLMQSTAREWTGRFRNVREGFSFAPRGGDDDGSGREVEVQVFPAPAVAGVRTELRFPEYTGLGVRAEPRGDVEAPVGTAVRVIVDSTVALASARLAFEGNGGEVALERIPDAPESGAESWAGVFDVMTSSSYTVQLEGANGFHNLEPGNYAVVAVKDRAPIVKVVEPGLSDLDVTPSGLVPFRVAADDDYGIAELAFEMKPFGGESARTFDLLKDSRGGARESRRLVYTLLDLAQTPFIHGADERIAQASDSFVYRVYAADNRAGGEGAADPNRTEVTDRRVDVVSENEMLRVLTERQIRRKEDVAQLRALQEEKLQRLKDLLADYEASEGDAMPDATDLASLEVGQNQVSNRALRLSAEFADIFEAYLLNRIDRSASAERLFPMLIDLKRGSDVIDGLDFGVYRPIVDAYRAGNFGNLDVLGRLLEMLAAILDVSETLSPQAATSIGNARLLVDPSARPARLREALATQQQVLERLDVLLEKLDEWEDFQEILAIFRDVLDDQRDLNAKTRDALRGEGDK